MDLAEDRYIAFTSCNGMESGFREDAYEIHHHEGLVFYRLTQEISSRSPQRPLLTQAKKVKQHCTLIPIRRIIRMPKIQRTTSNSRELPNVILQRHPLNPIQFNIQLESTSELLSAQFETKPSEWIALHRCIFYRYSDPSPLCRHTRHNCVAFTCLLNQLLQSAQLEKQLQTSLHSRDEPEAATRSTFQRLRPPR